MEPPPREGAGDPSASTPTTARAAADISSPFLQAAASSSASEQQPQRSTGNDRAPPAATAIEVGKPLPKSVAPLYAENDDYDDSSGSDSDSSFGSRLLDHDGKLKHEFFFHFYF